MFEVYKEDSIQPVDNDIITAFNLYKYLLTTNYDIEDFPPSIAENKTFGISFPGAHIRKPQYYNCVFLGSRFESSDGALTKLHSCTLKDCYFENCDLRYCDIYKSQFISPANKMKIASCNFSFGNFIKSQFLGTSFSGCSFRQMQFEETEFNSCSFIYCSLEQSTISNCIMKNLDFRKVGVRYCDFSNTLLENVVFHILDLPRNFGLIQLLEMSNKPVKVAFKNDQTMSLRQALVYLENLIPFYYETEQFYELINVWYSSANYDNILNFLPIAFERVIKKNDFSALQDLCSLVVKLNVCNKKQLRDFYVLINQLIVPDEFPHYLRKSYNTYIENIKYILVDNPSNNPEASIVLKTDILSLGNDDMSKLLMSIEKNIEELAPGVDTTIQLTHHSPYDVFITLVGDLPEILTVCQIFYYCLGGAKSFSDLKNSKREKVKKKIPSKENTTEKTNKRIELSIGKHIDFKYEKEYTSHVESLEYTIK